MIRAMGVPCPKPRPRLLGKREKASEIAAKDRAERAKCRVRGGGQCEVLIRTDYVFAGEPCWYRCFKRASENHHLIGGTGRRNKGRSILAAHRLECCATHHKEITGHVLQPVGTQAEQEAAAAVRYERVK